MPTPFPPLDGSAPRQQQFAEPVYKRARESLEREHHGKTVGEWMMRFVANARRSA